MDKYRPLATIRGGILMFQPVHALALLDEAQTNKLALLGFDAFYLRGGETRPSLENGWDYSSKLGAVQTPYNHARQFIQDRANTDLYFEIVLADRIPPL